MLFGVMVAMESSTGRPRGGKSTADGDDKDLHSEVDAAVERRVCMDII